MGDTSDLDCSQLHSVPNLTDLCWFVQNTSSCDIDEGFINYTVFLYCTMDSVAVAISCIILFVWWLFLFCGLAVTADDFFCPSLAVISQSLKLSHNVAGVTFLAFGNGAPDIFSAIAAIGNAKKGDAGLAIGALFGAGVFVTAVVAGSIAIIQPFDSMQRPFLRDVIFYLAATYWAWYVMWDKKITQMEAAGFIMLYACYVIFVIAGRYFNQRMKNRRSCLSVTDVDVSEETLKPLLNPRRENPLLSPDDVMIQEAPVEIRHRDTIDAKDGLIKSFFKGINPIDTEEWSGKRFYWKIFECFKSPLVILLKLTVPVVGEADPEEPNDLRAWNRLLNSVHCFTGPTFAILATKVGFGMIGDAFPVYALVMMAAAAVAILVFVTSKTDRRPVYHTAFAYLGFLIAVVWIYSVANEIVNILQTFGVVFNLSDAILGLTLLAWGNSIGDLVADTTMARQGYPRMGISACFGGPLFNLLLGLGIPFTIACAKKGGVFELEVNLEQMVLAGGLGFSLVASLIIVPLSGFRMSRPYGIFLVILYVVFLTIAVLTESDVIKNTIL